MEFLRCVFLNRALRNYYDKRLIKMISISPIPRLPPRGCCFVDGFVPLYWAFVGGGEDRIRGLTRDMAIVAFFDGREADFCLGVIAL